MTRLLQMPEIFGEASDLSAVVALNENEDKNGESFCSDRCSQKTCSDCCGAEDCEAECAQSCDGFVDCDDDDACTRADCAIDSCCDAAPPCFEAECTKLTGEEINAAAQLAASSTLSLDSWPAVAYSRFTDFLNSHDVNEEPLQSMLVHGGSTALTSPSTAETSPNTPLESESALSPSPSKRRKTFGDDRSIGLPNNGVHIYGDQYQFCDSDRFSHEQQRYDVDNQSEWTNQTAMSMSETRFEHPVPCQWGNECDLEFYNNAALGDHIFQNHVKSPDEVPCRWHGCTEYTVPDDMLTHVKSHTSNDDRHICLWAGCSGQFRLLSDLEEHLRTAHIPTEPLCCQWEDCGALAEDPTDLSMHLQTNHFVDPSLMSLTDMDDKEIKCQPTEPICQWVEQDMELPGGLPSPSVRRCRMQFATTNELQQHVKIAHIWSQKKHNGYVCLWGNCPRRGTHSFSQKSKLDRHVQCHTGFKACQCQTCGERFSALQALQQHERRHTGEKPFSCEFCGKEFAQGSALTMHVRTHTKERPLMCDYPGCGRYFSESSNLSKHKKIHQPVGRHRCAVEGCSKSFHRMDQLKRHYQSHEKQARKLELLSNSGRK